MAEGGLDSSSKNKTFDVHSKELNYSNNDNSSDRDGEPNTDKDFQPLCKQLTDVGNYSYSALCAMSLRLLFEDHWHKRFKKDTLKMILEYMDQPEQVRVSIEALLEGHGMDETTPYIDLLLEEAYLKNRGDLVITDMVTMAIRNGCYDSRMRVLIKHVAWQLRVSWDSLEEIESSLARALVSKQYELSQEEITEKTKEERKAKAKRIALIGLATVGGGALIGLTGGLAAPFVAVGAGAIIGGAGAAVLGSTVGIAVIGSLFGAAGAGLTGYKMKKRVGDIEEFEFESLSPNPTSDPEEIKQLHITVAVTGWVTNEQQDFRAPWKQLAESREQYSLKWESQYLMQLGAAMTYLVSGAVSVATQEALKYTILSGLVTAVAWPAILLSAAGVIDNPWSVAMQRAHNTGKKLAEVLLAREQGQRPVTLIGFSLGARVIYTCLKEMAQRKGSDGIVEDVILLGAPVSGAPQFWEPLGRIVGGKIINGYCRGDWLLKFLYRTASVQIRVAGLGPVKWDNRRMHNIDLSDVVNGHTDYLNQLDNILKIVGVRTKDSVSVARTEGDKSDYANTDPAELNSRLIAMKAATPVEEESGISINLDDLTSSDDDDDVSEESNAKTRPAQTACKTDEFKEKNYEVNLCLDEADSLVVKAKISTSSVSSDSALPGKESPKLSSRNDSESKPSLKNDSGTFTNISSENELTNLSSEEAVGSKSSNNMSGNRSGQTDETCLAKDSDGERLEWFEKDDGFETFENDDVLTQKLSNVDYYHLTFEDD